MIKHGMNKILVLVLWISANFGIAADWAEVLGPSLAKIPPPQIGKVNWRAQVIPALKEAQQQNRPLFITLRCLPCKQCAEFDREVLEGGTDLDPLLKQFITVRLTNAEHLDFRIFPVEGFQDLDLSWWGWLLSPQGEVYGIFGGKDHISETNRISKAALMNSLNRVLDHHYDPRRISWKIDGPKPDLSAKFRNAFDLPGWKSWEARPKHEKVTCLHCHQLQEVLWEPKVVSKMFDKENDFDRWPLPENVGITLDRDHGLRVTKVTPGSAAERAGLKSGDILGAAGGRRLFGQADFRGVLHRGPRAAGNIEVVWLRDNRIQNGVLKVQPGWRKTNLNWRMSVSQGNVGSEPGFFPLAINNSRRGKMGIPANQMAIEPYMGTNKTSAAYRAGIRQNYIVSAVNGESPNVAGRAWLVWFRKNFDPGKKVKMTVHKSPTEKFEAEYLLE